MGSRDEKNRRRVLRRCGQRCEWVRAGVGIRCTQEATLVDQIRPGDDSPGNLRGLCVVHYAAVVAGAHEASKCVAIKVRPPKDAE